MCELSMLWNESYLRSYGKIGIWAYLTTVANIWFLGQMRQISRLRKTNSVRIQISWQYWRADECYHCSKCWMSRVHVQNIKVEKKVSEFRCSGKIGADKCYHCGHRGATDGFPSGPKNRLLKCQTEWGGVAGWTYIVGPLLTRHTFPLKSFSMFPVFIHVCIICIFPVAQKTGS